LKRRIFIGLIIIFAVIVVGGGFVSRIMSQLYSANQARFLTDEVSHTINRLDLMVLQGIQEIEQARVDESRVRRITNSVEQIEILMVDLNDQVMSDALANNSCGLCHENPGELVRDLQNLIRTMEDSFADLTKLTSMLITSDLQNGLDQLIKEIGESLDRHQNRLTDIQNVVSPMMEHIDLEVNSIIVRIKRTHDITIVLFVLMILAGMITLVATVTRPLKQLTKGT